MPTPESMPDQSPTVIRPVREDDFAAWSPLWAGYNAFYGRLGATALPEAISRLTWQRFFQADEPLYALVAERLRAVGFSAPIVDELQIAADQLGER